MGYSFWFVLSKFTTSEIIGIASTVVAISTIFFTGWVLLRVLGVKDFQRPDLTDLSLSFALSIGLSTLIFLIVSQTGLEIGKTIFGIYIIISILPVLIDRVLKQVTKQQPKINNKREFGIFEVLILLWITAFFVAVISMLYPETAFLPGLDIVGHFSSSNQILNNPELFGSVYPTYHSMLATLNVLSSAPMWLIQSGLASLSIIVVFSFYIMAKGYLNELNKRAPLLATIFFFVFSGFGWIYYLQQRLNLIDLENYFRILLSTIQITYLDTYVGQGLGLWVWLRPVTLGFTIFFVMLYLLKNDSLSKRNYVIITSLLVGSLAGVHFPELVIFVLLIFVLSIFKPSIKLRLKETAISILIGLAIWVFLLFSYQQFFDSQYQIFSFQFLSILVVLSGISLALLTFHKRPSFTFKINQIVIASAALFVYVILLLSWFSGIDEVLGFDFKPVYAVPSEYYPVLLGIVGGIAIGGAIIVAKKYGNHPLILFVILFILAIVVGNIITYVNLNYFDTGYFERRLVLFVYIAASILASITFLYILKCIAKINPRILKSLVYGFTISIIITAGIFSTFLAVEYNFLRLSAASMTEDEISLLSHLSQVDSNSILLTVTDRSKDIAKYGNLGDVVNQFRLPLWTSKNPEQTLNVISPLNSSTIIYLNPKDSNEISLQYENGYINSHLSRMGSLLYDGPEGKIIQIPSVSSPSSKSQVALVLPEESAKFHHVYDILSLGGFNYTTILLSDLDSLQEARVVITPNEEMTLKMIDFRKNYSLKFEKLILLNTGGYGSFLFEKHHPLFLKDNYLEDWIPQGSGSGTIGVPTIGENFQEKKSGKKSTEINVGTGNYSLWTISKEFKESANFSEFGAIKFHWYGKNDGNWYVVQFTSDPGNHFWYRFQDSWLGWKQVILPTNMPDGIDNLLGVNIHKVTKEGASWQKINKIEFKTASTTQNQKGVFYLDGFTLDNYFLSDNIKFVATNHEIKFPDNFNVNEVFANPDFEVKAYYHPNAPFLLHREYDGFDLDYFDLNPIIERLNPGDEQSREIYPYLGKLLNLSDIQLPLNKLESLSKFTMFSKGVFTFKSAIFQGDLMLEADSTIINLKNNSLTVNLIDSKLELENVVKIIPINIEKVTVNAAQGVLKDGKGFYSRVLLNQSSVQFVGRPAIISIFDSNGEIHTISSEEIEIKLPESTFLIRQPKVSCDGITKFENFYGFGKVPKNIRFDNENFQINGKVILNNKLSDEFTISVDNFFKGKITKLITK